MKKNKKLLPLISSLALLTTPVIMVTACSYEINRYKAALPNDMQNRILFDFINVNYSVNAKSYFDNIFSQGMEFIKKEVEGIIAHEEFMKFFIEKLGYSDQLAEKTFTEIKDNLGLDILATDYFNSINNGESLDDKDTTKLVFQTDNWHQEGTTRFNYARVPFYTEMDENTGNSNDPNELFTESLLYAPESLTGEAAQKWDYQFKNVAKYADDHYNEDIEKLTQDKFKWDSPTTTVPVPPTLIVSDGIQIYQKKLERFKWWLRFRYQQYYSSVILPQLNQTLFAMSNILKNILVINSENTPILIDSNGTYSSQLQGWGANSVWNSQYRMVWDYTTNKSNAINIDNNWDNTSNPTKLPNLMTDNKTINSNFLIQLASTDQTLKNSVDPLFGINGFVSNFNSKDYNESIPNNGADAWASSKDGFHYWGSGSKGSFAYWAPVYWIDVILNLDFKFYQNRDNSDPKVNQRIIKSEDGENESIISQWTSAQVNRYSAHSNLSEYIRADYINDGTSDEYINKQTMKWNIFWQMLYSLSSQIDSNPNKESAANNFDSASKALFPEYIPKDKIYNIDFWNAVSSYY